MGKNLTIALLAMLLLASNAWQFYATVDQSVTMSYMDSELYELRNTRREMEKLLTHYVRGTPAVEVETLLEVLFPDANTFRKNGYIHCGFLSFKLDGSGKLVESSGYQS